MGQLNLQELSSVYGYLLQGMGKREKPGYSFFGGTNDKYEWINQLLQPKLITFVLTELEMFPEKASKIF